MPPTNRDLTPANRLLAALPKKEYQRLLPELEQVVLTFGEILHEPGNLIRHVYFPVNSIVSLLSKVAEHSTLEVGIVGNEGMAGISAFMGINQSSHRALVQGTGAAMKMKVTALHEEVGRMDMLHRVLQRYTYLLLTQVSQSAACNRFHTVDARLARWLLMTQDGLGSDQFQLTQEFMSNMLGVRREGVNKAAGALQKNKLINYRRGHMTILNRQGLEGVACMCYRFVKNDSDNFLNNL